MSKSVLLNRHYGYSLLEMSMVLLISAILLASVMIYSVVRSEQDKINLTISNMKKIEQAVAIYLADYGTIPCPADSSLSNTSANYGVSIISQGSNYNNCASSLSQPSSGWWWIVANAHFVIGGVPILTLNLPPEVMYDGWGRRINYTMKGSCIGSPKPYLQITSDTTAQVSNNTYNSSSPTTNTFNSTIGNDCVDSGNMLIVQNTSGGNNITSNAILVLVSYGRNGHGAILHNGGSPYNAKGTISTDEIVNAQINAAGTVVKSAGYFVQKAQVLIKGANYFDDIVRFKTRDQLLADAGMINYASSQFSKYLCDMAYTTLGASLSNPYTGSYTSITNNVCGQFAGTNCSKYLYYLASQIYQLCS